MTRTARTRKHRGFDLEARLAPVEQWIERDPAAWRGRWRTWMPESRAIVSERELGDAPSSDGATQGQPWRAVHVDLGCGKGEFAIGMAKANPDVLFIGIDSEPVCAMHGGECACAAQVENAVFTIDEQPDMLRLFAPAEVDAIYLNFSTPHPKRKHATQRLTYVDRLIAYRRILAPDGFLFVKTDSDPFMQFTRSQLELAGYTVVWETDDCQRLRPDDPQTQYERKLVARGAKVLALKAVPNGGPLPNPAEIEQTQPLSLYAYLPDDLDALEYVPHGMNAGVENERYRRHREAEKNNGVVTEFWTRA